MLKNLINYSSDDDEDQQLKTNNVQKRIIKDKKKKSKKVLELPHILKDKPQKKQKDNLRQVPHIEGIYSSQVYIQIDNIDGMISEIQNKFRKMITDKFNIEQQEVKLVSDLHLSLSKNFYINHHQIEPLYKDINNQITEIIDSFNIGILLDQLVLLLNENQKIAFLCLKIDLGQKQLTNLVKEVDQIMLKYNQSVYYQKPIYHVSILEIHDQNMIKRINQYFKENGYIGLQKQNKQNLVLNINNIIFKTGQNLFNIILK